LSSFQQPNELCYLKAIDALKNGGIVAYPTETFYGLAVDPDNDQAIESLYSLKKREKQKAVSLLIPDYTYLSSLVSSRPAPYNMLIESFWPGPLTLIFSALDTVSNKLTDSENTIAIRVSSNCIAQKLCSSWGNAITATSANISGERAMITAAEVVKQWGNKITYIIDGGTTPGGNGSTILRCLKDQTQCEIVREGSITKEQIVNILPSHYTICNV
jgi:L-threonylcarbamoyladenylate synthase